MQPEAEVLHVAQIRHVTDLSPDTGVTDPLLDPGDTASGVTDLSPDTGVTRGEMLLDW